MSASRCWPLEWMSLEYSVGGNGVETNKFALHHFRKAEDGVERRA